MQENSIVFTLLYANREEKVGAVCLLRKIYQLASSSDYCTRAVVDFRTLNCGRSSSRRRNSSAVFDKPILESIGDESIPSAAKAHPTFMKTAQAQRKSIPVFEVKWKGAHKLYIVPPAADSEPLSPTSAATDSAIVLREPETLLSQPTSSLFDVAVKNELLDSWNRSQTGTGKSIASYQPRQTEPRAPELSTSQQRSIKPNSSAKNNLLDSWNSNTGFGEHISGWFVRFMEPGPDTKTRAMQSLLLANGINQSTAAADTGALDDLSYPDIESDCDIGSQSDSEMHFSGKRTAMELDRSDGPGQFSWLCNYLSGSLNSISSSTVVPEFIVQVSRCTWLCGYKFQLKQNLAEQIDHTKWSNETQLLQNSRDLVLLNACLGKRTLA
eukprot:g8750.t1